LNSLKNTTSKDYRRLGELRSRDSDERRSEILDTVDLVKSTAVILIVSVKRILRDLRNHRGRPILGLSLRRGINGSERDLLGVSNTEVVSIVELNEGLGKLEGSIIGRGDVDEGDTAIILTTDEDIGDTRSISVEEDGNGALAEEERSAVGHNGLETSAEALITGADEEEGAWRAKGTRRTAEGSSINRTSDDGNDTTERVTKEAEVVGSEATEDSGGGNSVEANEEVLSTNSNEGRGLLDTLAELSWVTGALGTTTM